MIKQELEQSVLFDLPKNTTYKIGIIGAGFIVDCCHLVAYGNLGFNPYAITSLSMQQSQDVANRHNIQKVHASWEELILDKNVEILDIAVPPHNQLEIVEFACKQKHIKGILCQKPTAMNYEDAKKIAELGKLSGIPIAVNSNMRYDQSIMALKYALERNLLGTPVLFTTEQRAIPHWQKFLEEYDRLTVLNFSIHEIDIFRYLFGNPLEITALSRTDPRTQFPHKDGIVQYTYQYDNGFMAVGLDDVYTGPDCCQKDNYIKWRFEGTKGIAIGSIGWVNFPQHCPDTFKMSCESYPDNWIEPIFKTAWFPDAFGGTMASLLCAVEKNETPAISALDHATTLACVEGIYRSIKEKKTIRLNIMINE